MSTVLLFAAWYAVPILGIAWVLRDARRTLRDSRDQQAHQERQAIARLYPGVVVFPSARKPARRWNDRGHGPETRP